MTTALITGACGFCARYLANRLAQEADAHVTGLDVLPQAPADLPLHAYYPVDVRDAAQVAAVVREVRPGMVFHLAGRTGGSSADLFETNLLGGIHLLEAIRNEVPDARVLVVGSAAEYGRIAAEDLPVGEDHACHPAGDYGLSKYAMTLFTLDAARRHGLKAVVVRPFNIVGPGIPQTLVVGAVLARAKQALAASAEPVVPVGNLNTQRDFLAVEDAVDGYLRALKGGRWGDVYNICSGRPCSIRALMEQLLSFAPRPIRLRVEPALVRPADVPIVYGSWQKAHATFGFAPQADLGDALRAAWNHGMLEEA